MIILLYRFDTSNVWRTILKGTLGLNALLALGILFTLFVSREWTATVGLVLTELVVLGFTQVLFKAQEGSIGILNVGATFDMIGTEPRARFVRAFLRGMRELGDVYGRTPSLLARADHVIE